MRSECTQPAPLLLTAKQTAELFGVGIAMFHAVLRRQPWFPQPVVLSSRFVRWHRSEVEACLANAPRGMGVAEPANLSAPEARAKAKATKASKRAQAVES